jgi:WD40 repeat protein
MELVMKKLLLGLVLLTGSQLHSADALGEPPAKRVRIEEKPVTLILLNEEEVKIPLSLVQACKTLRYMREYHGEESNESISLSNEFVTQDTLGQFAVLQGSEVSSVEDVLAIINQYSLEQLVRLFLANNFLDFSKEFTMEDETTKQLADILFEKIIEVLIATEDVNAVGSALTFLDQLPNIAEYFKPELYKRAPWVSLYTLQGHTNGIAAVAFSPDGQLIATASADGTAKIWNTLTGKLLHTLQGHTSWIPAVAFSPDGQLIATASADGTAKIWNTLTGKLLHTLKGHTGHVYSVAFSPDGQLVVTASRDNTAKLWNAQKGQLLHTLQGHTDWINSVAFSPDGQWIVTASHDRTAKLWNPQTGVCLGTLQGHTDSVLSVAFSPDSLMVVTSSNDRTVKLWNVQTGQCLHTLEGQSYLIHSVAFSPDGQWVVTASRDNTAKLWNAATGICLHTLQGHNNPVFSVAFSPDGQLIVTFSSDRTAKLWNLKTGELLRNVSIHSSAPTTARLSSNGSMIAVGAIDGTVNILVSNLTKKGVNLQKALELSLQDLLYLLNTDRTLEDLENIRKIEELLREETLASDSLQKMVQTQVAGPAETRPEEPPAKLRKGERYNPFDVRHAHPGRSQVDSEDSLSDEGEDEEFFCKFCNQQFDGQKELKKHEKKCDKKAPAYNEDDWL